MKSIMGNYEMQVNVSNNFQKRNVNLSCLSEPIFLTSLITKIVGVIMGSVVASIDKLHSPTLANTIMVAIAAIIYTVGVILHIYIFNYIYDIICLVLTGVLSIPAFVLSLRVRRLSKKWKITIFSIMCVLLVFGTVPLVIVSIFRYVVVLCSVSWCCFTIIVIILTPYFLNLHDRPSMYKPYYLLFVLIYEVMFLCSFMLFAFTPFDQLKCDNKTMSNVTLIA
ncbi:hypothetical protein KSF78_0008015 [Schistosoma japonicum]|nr:hypothetical protein KSF78_0008015 [Schistosoma japonicum]KAH8873407.1 hypothetical protein KSF78_0008015 [Schistosoma japonicum]